MILCVPKQTLTTAQKNTLSKKGYIVIECDDPEKIRVINPETNIDTNDYFMSALRACTVNIPIGKTEIFVNTLYNRLKKKEEDLIIVETPETKTP